MPDIQKPTKQKFSEQVKKARREAGLSQTELAEAIEAKIGEDFPGWKIAQMESAEPRMSLETAKIVAKFLKLAEPVEFVEKPEPARAPEKKEEKVARPPKVVPAAAARPRAARPNGANGSVVISAGQAIDEIEAILERVPNDKRGRVFEWIERDMKSSAVPGE